MSPAAVVFAVGVAVSAYVYLGYPLLLWALARLRPRPVGRAPVRPRMSVIIPAHSEADVIAEKLRDTLSNGYAEGLLEVIVASDGSTDATVPTARAFGDPRVRVLDLPRRGKAAALNAAVERATGDVLVFTDADVLLGPGALGFLAENFADLEVGGVTGRKVHTATGSRHITRGEGLYARYEEWQKGLESAFGSTVASHGALHAVRRELFVPISDLTAADDMAISVPIVLQGRRLVCDPRAEARVEAPADGAMEFERKVRIANQVLWTLIGQGGSLWTSGFYSVQLVSHKLLRYLVPVFLVLILGSNVWLSLTAEGALWDLLLGLQGGFYGAAALGAVTRKSAAGRFRLLTVPYYFCLVNASALVAVLSVMRGRRTAGWSPRGGLDRETCENVEA